MHSPKCKTSPDFPVAFSKLLPSLASTYSSTEAEIIWRYPAQASVHRMWDVSKWNGPTKMSGKKRVDLQYLAQKSWIEGMQTYTCKNLCLNNVLTSDMVESNCTASCHCPAFSQELIAALKITALGAAKNNAISFNNCKAFSIVPLYTCTNDSTKSHFIRQHSMKWHLMEQMQGSLPLTAFFTGTHSRTASDLLWWKLKLCHGM